MMQENRDTRSPLELYGSDLVDKVKSGKLDPVIGRDQEINRLDFREINRSNELRKLRTVLGRVQKRF